MCQNAGRVLTPMLWSARKDPRRETPHTCIVQV